MPSIHNFALYSGAVRDVVTIVFYLATFTLALKTYFLARDRWSLDIKKVKDETTVERRIRAEKLLRPPIQAGGGTDSVIIRLYKDGMNLSEIKQAFIDVQFEVNQFSNKNAEDKWAIVAKRLRLEAPYMFEESDLKAR